MDETAVAGQLKAGLDALLDCDVDGLSSAELVGLVRSVECQRRRLAAVDVRLLAALRDRGVAAEHCRSSVADLLTAELLVSPGEAKARVLAAEDLALRVTLTGETLEPALPRVAAALALGEVSAAHVAVIGRTLDRLPAGVAYEVGPVAEQFLVQAARPEHPGALARTARLLLTRLDPDGPEPHDRNTRPGFALIRHASGWSTARGTLDPATTAALTALLDSLSAPGPGAGRHPRPETRNPTPPRRGPGDVPAPPAHRRPTQRRWRADHGGDDRHCRGLDDERAGADRARRPRPGRAAGGGCTDPTCNAEIIRVVTSETGVPLALGRTHRLATPAQRHALAVRDLGCCSPGCARPPAWTEAHHITAWKDGGLTDIDNLCLLCAFHHREHQRRGWTVRIAADGHPEWRPPAHLDPERKPARNRAPHVTQIEFAPPG